MKVAFIVGGFPRVSETWILTQVTGLLDLGHEVDIFARRACSEAAVHPAVAEYCLPAKTHYFEIPLTRVGRIWRAGIASIGVTQKHPKSLMRCLNFRRYKTCYRVINNIIFVSAFIDRNYDAILCHFGGNGIDFICLKDVFPNTRFLTMFHGDDYAIGDEQGRGAFTLLREWGDGFLVATDSYGRTTLKRYGFDENRIITHRYGIACEDIAFRERSLRNNSIDIVSVARLVPKKGLEIAIKAVSILRRRNPNINISYRIIGDGPLRRDLERLAEKLGAQESIQLLGAKSGPEVIKAMHQSDIYLLSSLMEQAGYVLLEAQACGLPVVATRVGGVADMVCDGESAILVEAGSVEQLALGLQTLIDHPERWGKMGAKGRSHVEKFHNNEILSRNLEKILDG